MFSFGLKTKKKEKVEIKPSIFGDGEEVKEETVQKKEATNEPTIGESEEFCYDELYDETSSALKEKKKAVRDRNDRRPRYLSSLIKAAQDRKVEQEFIRNKRAQRLNETDSPSEVFVSESYKQKLKDLGRDIPSERILLTDGDTAEPEIAIENEDSGSKVDESQLKELKDSNTSKQDKAEKIKAARERYLLRRKP